MTETLDESSRNKRTAKRVLAIFLPLVVVAGVGVGYAYWTAGGTGAGTASTAAGLSAITLTADPVSGLTPGGTAIPVDVLADNSGNTSPVHVNAFSTVTVGLASGNTALSCTVATASLVATATPLSPAAVVPAGATGYKVGTLTVSMTDTSGSQDTCKSASFSFSFTSS